MAIYWLLRSAGVSFDPEAIYAMHSAYEDVCAQFGISNEKNGRVTEIVALKIIEIATTGERDMAAMRDSALRSLGLIGSHPQW